MQHSASEEAESSFDFGELRDRASYVTRAAGRHPVVLVAVALVTLLGAALVAWVLPDRYKVEARLIAQEDDLIASLSNPGRPVLGSETNPATSTVSDMVLRRDNLLSIIRQANLLQVWRATRPPVYQLKDWVVFRHRLSDEELTEVLAGTLEKRISASAQPGGVITVSVLWHDPVMAQKITETVLANFIENRNVNEMAILGESIALLEERLREADKAMDETLSSARSIRRPARSASYSPAPDATPRMSENVELARLHSEIAAKRRALDDLITFRDRRVAELQAQLAEQRAVYAESHPIVANLRRTLETISADSPQIIQQRHELADLEARYVTRGGSAATLEGIPTITRPSGGNATTSLLAALGTVSRDPGEEYARSRLTSAIAHYYSIADRLESARIERDAARANIKFRYVVVKPPLPPRESMTGPYKAFLIVLGAIAAPLLGIAAAFGQELRRGRVVQGWQLERSLGLPVLAVVSAANRQR